ncbi:MAG: valine--tRNA ligase [Deltaproteobacteria bacterium]|nr:valine--tRNA ligase [Deltaproteobacteria bacterium]
MENELLDKSYNPQDVEDKWYQYWIDRGYFRALDKSDREPFCIVIPPPNVTGMLHMGHALNNTLQDIVIRFKRMQGYNTLWMPGTDHAGIATQNVVEQELAREGTSRAVLGREKFIERVWEWREKYGGIILNQLQKLGCSCDWSRERFTMDDGLSRAVRKVFVDLYNEGLVYQGDYIVNWCPRCHTAISDLEVEYEEEATHLWHIRYPFADGSGEVVVATTRPETMLGDTAVAVNPDDDRYRGLVGKTVILPLVNKEIPIIADDYVSKEFGTGAVKITPACDPNDFAMAERHGLEIVIIMDGNAIINENGGIYEGQDCYTCRNNVVEDLKKQGYFIKEEPYTHNVGRCYRCKTIVEPAVSKQWFVRVKPLAKEASAAVIKGKTRIIPKTWEGTYFEWLENIRDWCISRQIWWGHRIPVWYCGDCGRIIVQVDEPEACPDCGGTSLRQEEDVLDTWFSSALWPFSTLGWPENTEALKTFYPTSLLVTGFDIIFFWVARMMMMGLHFMGDVPFHDVYLHALVRDERGEKMSKSKGNSIDPLEMIERYGADAFRFTMAAFAAQGRDVKMSEGRIEGYRHFVNKIWNTARFSLMNLADFPPAENTGADGDLSLGDRWIKDRLNETIREVTRYLEEYRFNDAANVIYQFFWHEFCDWYVEMIKPVLYSVENGSRRRAAQATLRLVLKDSLLLLHPFMPFVTEEIWKRMDPAGDSIMISGFPAENDDLKDKEAEYRFNIIRDIITSIRNIRGVVNIPPSKKLNALVVVSDEELRAVIDNGADYITDLANLSKLTIQDRAGELHGVAVDVVGSIRIFVFLEGLVDVAVELARQEKKQEKLAKEIAVVSRKLGNADFMEKALPEIIEKEQDKFEELKRKSDILETSIRRLREIEA